MALVGQVMAATGALAIFLVQAAQVPLLILPVVVTVLLVQEVVAAVAVQVLEVVVMEVWARS